MSYSRSHLVGPEGYVRGPSWGYGQRTKLGIWSLTRRPLEAGDSHISWENLYGFRSRFSLKSTHGLAKHKGKKSWKHENYLHDVRGEKHVAKDANAWSACWFSLLFVSYMYQLYHIYIYIPKFGNNISNITKHVAYVAMTQNLFIAKIAWNWILNMKTARLVATTCLHKGFPCIQLDGLPASKQ